MNTSFTLDERRLAPGWQTARNALYLLIAFPLGLLYFIVLVVGIATGFATLIIWVGAALLVGMMFAWWALARFERHLAIAWLGASISPLVAPTAPEMTLWRRIVALLRSPLTWKSLVYLLLKFPFGVVSFTMTLLLAVTSLTVAIVSLALGALSAPFVALGLMLMGGAMPGRRLRRYLLVAATGFGLGVLAVLLIDRMAALARYLAETLLGTSADDLRVQAMVAQVAQERTRAEQADLRRRRLIVDMSHELRTPITSIAGHLESLLLLTDEGTASRPPEPLFGYLRTAQLETQRLGAMVDELLSLARMESDELRLDIQPVAPREIIEAVYQALAPLAQHDRGVTLVRGADPALSLIQADPGRLTQILLNLVRNAIAYTPVGGVVSLSAEAADGERLALIVEDNGVGIPAADLPHIFERFYRADASRTRATGGFGLGLAIVRDLVGAMGGSITVASAEGAGTRFCVLLRLAPS